jgi:hypothetical protein
MTADQDDQAEAEDSSVGSETKGGEMSSRLQRMNKTKLGKMRELSRRLDHKRSQRRPGKSIEVVISRKKAE